MAAGNCYRYHRTFGTWSGSTCRYNPASVCASNNRKRWLSAPAVVDLAHLDKKTPLKFQILKINPSIKFELNILGFTRNVELMAAFNVTPDNGQSAFVNFSRSSDLTSAGRRESVKPDQLAVGQARRSISREQSGNSFVNCPVDGPASFLHRRQNQSVGHGSSFYQLKGNSNCLCKQN